MNSSYTYEKTYNYLNTKFGNKYILVRKCLVAKDNDGQKYAIFELINNYRDIVQEIKIQIIQYDKDNNVINTTDVPYKGLSIKHHGKFSPYFKFVLDSKCEKIKAGVLIAKFDKHLYKNGKLIRIKKDEVPKEKVEKDRFIKRYNAISTKKHKKVMKGIAVAGLVVLGILLVGFSANNKNAVYNDIEYNKLTGEVVSYLGNKSSVVIPKEIKSTNINKIGEKAFLNSSIISVEIEAENIEIDDWAFVNCQNLRTIVANNISKIGCNAFENCVNLLSIDAKDVNYVDHDAFKECKKLQKFEFPGVTFVGSFAFNGCTNLRTFKCEEASLSMSVFKDNESLREITYKKSYMFNSRLSSIFVGNNEFSDLTVNLTDITYEKSYLDGFDCGAINFLNGDLNLPSDLYNKWVNLALEKGKIANGSQFKTIFNVAVEANDSYDFTDLNISDPNIKSILSNVFNSVGRNIINLQITNGMKLSANSLRKMTNLQTIKIGSTSSIEKSGIVSRNITYIELPVIGNEFIDLFFIRPVTLCSVRIVGNKTIPSKYFDNCQFVEKIDLSKFFGTISTNAITNSQFLKYVDLGYGTYREGMIGEGCTKLNEVSLSQISVDDVEVTFDKINKSYQYVKKINITSTTNVALADNCFSKCERLKDLYFMCEVRNDVKNITDGIIYLDRVVIRCGTYNNFHDLFGNTYVTNLLIEYMSPNENYFEGANVTNLFLGKASNSRYINYQSFSYIETIYVSSECSSDAITIAKILQNEKVRAVYTESSYSLNDYRNIKNFNYNYKENSVFGER